MKKQFFSLLVMMLFFSTVCYGKGEWKAEDYNFKSISTILVMPEVNVLETNRYIGKYRIANLFTTEVLQASQLRISFVTYQELEDALGKSINEDMKILKETDKKRYDDLMDIYVNGRIDGILTVGINHLNSWSVHVPEQRKTDILYRSEIQYVSHYDPQRGSTSTPIVVQVPYENSYTVPAHDKIFSSGTVHFSLCTAKDFREVWNYESHKSIQTGYQDPLLAVEKALKDGMTKFSKLTGRIKHDQEKGKVVFSINEIQYKNIPGDTEEDDSTDELEETTEE